ncbi:MAG: hypothetical protein LBV41_06980 [Cytophagaceae bacterium]|jgi:hypothetical protein|nr:hypothetical protein [Cytophagaceae bacterium]
MRTNNKKWGLLIVILLIGTVSYSQYSYRGNSSNFLKGLSVTGKGALSMFYGDLVDRSRIQYLSGGGISFEREMHPYFSLRTQLMYTTMKGAQLSDGNGPEFANFTGSYVEWTVGGTYSFLNHALGYFRERTFQPYVLLQAGINYFNATEMWGPAGYGEQTGVGVNGKWRDASGIARIVGFGGGTSIWIAPQFKINLEFAGAYAFSDKLDAHDSWFVWPFVDEIYPTKSNDFYYTGTIGVTYIFKNSNFRNDSRFNRRTYNRTRQSYSQKSSRSGSYRR